MRKTESQKLQAIFIPIEGKARPIAPENSKHFTLEELYRVLHCELVEIIRLGSQGQEDVIMIVDENGKSDKTYNEIATGIALGTRSIFPHDYISGEVIVCPRSLFE